MKALTYKIIWTKRQGIIKIISPMMSAASYSDHDKSVDGSVQGRPNRPVLTQQIVMDLITSQPLQILQPSNAVQGFGWGQKKQGDSRLLQGYERPNGRTVQVAMELATLLIVFVAVESTNRIRLMAQNEARDKMIRQAEQHQEGMEKQFTESLARLLVKAENQKTIDEAKKDRNELTKLCQPANNNDEETLQKIDDKQGTCL